MRCTAGRSAVTTITRPARYFSADSRSGAEPTRVEEDRNRTELGSRPDARGRRECPRPKPRASRSARQRPPPCPASPCTFAASPGSQARDVIKVAVLPSAASPEAAIEMVVRAKGMSGSLAFPGRRLTSSWWKACTNWTCTTSTSVSRKRSRFTAARHDGPSVPVTCAGTGCCGPDSAMLVCHRPGG